MPKPWTDDNGNSIGLDVHDYVSGTIGLTGANARIAVFGGDVRASGSVSVGTGSVTITSNDVQFGSIATRIEKNGSDIKFFDASNPSGKTLSALVSGSGAADAGASYLVLANTASLSNERAFTVGTGLLGTDAGANSTYTLGINNGVVATVSGTTFTGPISSSLFTVGRSTLSGTYSKVLSAGQAGQFVATCDIDQGTSRAITIAGGNGAILFDLSIVVGESGFSVASKYVVACQYNASAVVNKIVDTGPYGAYDTTIIFTKDNAATVRCTISHNYPGTRNIGLTLDVPSTSTGATTTITIF